MLGRLIQKIRCSMPFNFSYFGHKNVAVVRKLSPQSQLILLLGLCAPAWGGDPQDQGALTPEYRKFLIERTEIWDGPRRSEEWIRVPSGEWVQVYPATMKQGKPAPWQIRTIPLSEANEFLRENPEWEPFGVYGLGGDYVILRRRVR